ncbi:zf-HC2 domain-containing protein [bacterium]|nr:zf-HC2 domain-containing protein [bacterium]
MNCSKISYCISEYIDNRLDVSTKRIVDNHLKKCKKCRSLYEEMLELRGLFMVKAYERPKAEYFENLKSNIKRRILSCNVVSLKDRFFNALSTPSIALSACLAVALIASITVNVMFYDKIQQNIQTAGENLKNNITQLASEKSDSNIYSNPQNFNRNLLRPANISGSYMITPITVRDVQAKRAKIYY